MFDFIEQNMSTDEKDTKAEVPVALEGTVYTMPSHRKTVLTPSNAPSNNGNATSSKKSGGLIALIAGIIVIVVASLGVVWWVAFRQAPAATPPAGSTANETPTTQPSETTPQPEQPTTPTETIPPSTPTPTPTSNDGTLAYVKGLDTDGDDLTDAEERLFGTDIQKPDTDGDNFLDGAEVKFLYDPTRPNPAKLDTGSSATVYTNPTYKYALLYPSAWVVDSIDKANKEVIFSSATGEFVSMTVQDNPEKLNALDWYTTVHQPNADTSSLQTMSYDTWTGVMSPDGLEVYMTAKDDSGTVITPYVYVLKYDLGDKKEMNFGAVFQMMIRSFLVTDLSFKR